MRNGDVWHVGSGLTNSVQGVVHDLVLETVQNFFPSHLADLELMTQVVSLSVKATLLTQARLRGGRQ